MTTFDKFSKTILIMGLSITFFACNNNAETPKEEPKKEADTTAIVAEPPTPVFQPFDVAVISHTVKDYGKWRPFFDADSVNRKAGGLELLVMGKSLDNPNDLHIVLTAADVQKAKDFATNPKLKDVMGKAGVISKPDIQLLHVIRLHIDSSQNKWVVIQHKVKDFDAWVKVYDSEGKEKRASEGMLDAALARGIDDPNLVYIVFDVTDVEKAKAAIFSDAKKKLMMSAGVEGVPVVKFYQTIE